MAVRLLTCVRVEHTQGGSIYTFFFIVFVFGKAMSARKRFMRQRRSQKYGLSYDIGHADLKAGTRR